ncbi:outer membrane beta-barrel protein [Photobacterium sp. J15]|uniref:outer membrane beta-barrel protein n=1 Tax=Photobacterium sp. J15 TaxID=265901 RepID=UPI0007E39212|nr:outer membrane beta-barrel protein [Photobacterium sp. J15]
MKNLKMLIVAMIAVLPAVSQAQDVQTYMGATYEHGDVKVGSRHTTVDGIKFQAASELGWGNFKGTAATLTGNGADYDNYTFAIEKPYSIQQSDFFVSPEAGVTYARYEDKQLRESDLGAMVGASLGYNINKQFQIVSNYNHSFGMKSNQDNIDEDSLSVGLNYRFN